MNEETPLENGIPKIAIPATTYFYTKEENLTDPDNPTYTLCLYEKEGVVVRELKVSKIHEVQAVQTFGMALKTSSNEYRNGVVPVFDALVTHTVEALRGFYARKERGTGV